MKKLDLAEATAPLAEYIKQLDDGLIITFRGVSLAALVLLDNVDYESIAVSESPRFREIIERSRQSIREGKGISSEDLRKEFEDH